MKFKEENIYHIYNQGNNRQKIFFNRDNYLFFLQKIRTYILPYGDVLAWCLMPNHFHLMVFVWKVEVGVKTKGFAQSESLNSLGVSQRHAETNMRTFNSSIGIMLMGYTRAVNKQQSRTGKLFREETKAECVTCPNEKLSPSFITINGITKIPLYEYPQVCFHYIHQNPIKSGLVKQPTDWEFSSAKDYAGLRNGNMVNKELAMQFVEYLD